MRARGCLLVVALVLCAGAGAPAQAADEREPAVVATDGGVELRASDENGQLCVSVGESGSDLDASCGDPYTGVLAGPAAGDGGGLYVGVAAPAAAAGVEVRRAGRVLGAAVTVAGEAYKGRAAGAVRFAIVRLAPAPRLTGLRVYAKDAAGTLISVIASVDDRRIADRHRVLSGRAGRVRWSLTEDRESSLAPTVIDPAHESVSRCVSLDVRVDGDASAGSSAAPTCTSGVPVDELVLGADLLRAHEADGCSPEFRVLHGVVAASVRHVTVLLGDGRRRSAQLAALRGGELRTWGLSIGVGDAVRSVRLESERGRREVLRQELAPLAVVCAVRAASAWTDYIFAFSDVLPALTPVGAVTTVPGSPAIRVADGPAETLCLTIGDMPFTAVRCALPAPGFPGLLSVRDRSLDPRALAFAVPEKVAAVRLSSADGKAMLTIPAVAAPGYAGRYAGHVRFAAATVSDYGDLTRHELLDGAGKVLSREDVPRIPSLTVRSGPARRVAGRAGAPSLWQARDRVGDDTDRCLTLTPGPRPTKDDGCDAYRSDATVLLDASCATHRLTLAVAVRSGTRVLADTGAAALRRVRLRDGAGLLTLRPRSPLRALTLIRQGRARRIALDAPPGARQCGWKAAPDVR